MRALVMNTLGTCIPTHRILCYVCAFFSSLSLCCIAWNCGHGGRHTHFGSEHNDLGTILNRFVFHLCHRLSDFIRSRSIPLFHCYASVSIALNEMERVISADIIIGIEEEAIEPGALAFIYSFPIRLLFGRRISGIILLSFCYPMWWWCRWGFASPCNCIFQLCQ